MLIHWQEDFMKKNEKTAEIAWRPCCIFISQACFVAQLTYNLQALFATSLLFIQSFWRIAEPEGYISTPLFLFKSLILSDYLVITFKKKVRDSIEVL